MWIMESLGLGVTSAQSRSSNMVTPGSSTPGGFYPVRSWTFLGVGTVKPLWAACDTALLPSWGKRFSVLFSLNLLCFSLTSLPPSSHLALLWRAWLHLIEDVIGSPGWTSLGPAASCHRARAPTPDHLSELLLNSVDLVLGAQKWTRMHVCTYVHVA